MSIDKRLEVYLTQLDKALGQISVSEKAEIVSEIKSHILDTLERNPEKSLPSILQSFGEPEAVATRYLTERGLKPVSAPKRQVVKWLTIGFLGTFGMILLFVTVMLWKFTPLIKVHDTDGREKIELFGGALNIDVDEDSFKFSDSDIDFKFNLKSDESSWVKDAKDLDLDQIKTLYIDFVNGSLDVKNHEGVKLSWKCRIKGKQGTVAFEEKNKGLYMSFNDARKVKCDIVMPQSLSLNVQGKNGKIEVVEPKSAVDVHLNNGKFEIDADQTVKYHYDMQLNNGKMDDFVSSDAPDAIDIKVKVNNGLISH